MKITVKLTKNIFSIILIILIFILLFSNLQIAKESAKNGMMLAGNVIIPSLFPFLVCTLIIYKYKALDIITFPKKFKHLKDYFIIFLLSNIGGYPIGAKLISEKFLNNEISRKDAELLLFCSINSGPAFSILTVGEGVVGSVKLGVIIYISQLFSALLMFLILSKKFSMEILTSLNNKKAFTEIFVESVSESSVAMLNICGYIVICSTILGIVNSTNINLLFKRLLNCTMEISNAVLSTRNVYILVIILSFASFSIIFQVLSICRCFAPSFIKIIISRIIHSVLSVGFTFIILKIFPQNIETIGNIKNNIAVGNNSVILTLLLLLTVTAFIYSINSKKYCGKISVDIF